MRVQDFDFKLPADLIAQRPLERRDDSRMMVVRRSDGTILHRTFRDLPDYYGPDDLLVLNDTKVIPAKAWGTRGLATIEFLFLTEREAGTWEVLCKPARRIRKGDRVVFEEGFEAEAAETGAEGRRVFKFSTPDVLGRLKKIGFAPLPPYIKRKRLDAASRSEDLARYQTVFAAREGAIAAPTAGLHFTPAVLDRLRAGGSRVVSITLHIGLATFQPLRVDHLQDHRMLEEIFTISDETAAEINAAKAQGRTVTAVGTTVVRTLESGNRFRGTTSLFIYPGFNFRVVDRLFTNFHLPQSTLLMLVSAFAGRELILHAYREAVRERYRFFSYGDAMLIL